MAAQDSRERAAVATLLANLAGDPATQIYNKMFADDLTALAKKLCTPGVAARATQVTPST